MEEQKTLKQYAKEAKKRLKKGFWQNYYKNLDNEIIKAKNDGLSESLVKDYYVCKVSESIRNSKDENEEFYIRVKKLLESEGEVSDAIGRLTDKKEYNLLSYEEKQRYTLNLSEKYIKAVERFNKEKVFER